MWPTNQNFASKAQIENDLIYARGALDSKAQMLSMLEAMRIFLRNNGQPQRSVYLAFGHDEEVNGLHGATEIAKYLNDTSLEYVLDEGSMVIEDLMPDFDTPTAIIGIAEKGYMTIRFHVNVTGGHSSMPDLDKSALVILSEAITKYSFINMLNFN